MLPRAKHLTKTDFRGIRPRIIHRGVYVDIAVVESTITKFACVVVKKRIKRSVDRNRVKRKVYHALQEIVLIKTLFVILYPKQTAISAPFQDIKKEIHQVFDTLR